VLAAAGALALAGCGGTVTATHTAEPAAATHSAKPVPGVNGYEPPMTTAPATAAPAPAPTPVTLTYSGTGDWNSPPFHMTGSSITVTYSYSGNVMAGETIPENIEADVVSSDDDQSIINAAGISGGTTTTLYPTDSVGSAYHLTIMATGSWSFKLVMTP
jgi:hypothetical protein